MEQRRPRLHASRKLHQFRYGNVRAAADRSLTRLGGRWHITIECATLLVVMARFAPMDVRLGAQGRLVLPASLRRALSLSAGDALVARVEGPGRIVLERHSAALARLQDRFAQTRGKRDLAASLIADRRSEAQRDVR
jgi:bifunctional DNA-binding transcriptional regulator/antitoxin component of YhaV-PrlF toxin-antitoxin module